MEGISSNIDLVEKNALKISYLGNIDFNIKGFRDMTNFFGAYDKLEFDKKNLLEIKFVGISENEKITELRKKYPEIKFLHKVSPKKALEEMINSNVLLNVHTLEDKSSKLLISGKIFDYIKSGRIILSITPEKSLVSTLIRDEWLGLAVKNKIDEIYESFLLLIEKFKNNELKSLRKESINTIETYSREYQNEKYLEIIKRM